MRIEKDGTLSLHECDVLSGIECEPTTIGDFTHQAEVAAYYCLKAGYEVQFVRPGKIVKLKGEDDET